MVAKTGEHVGPLLVHPSTCLNRLSALFSKNQQKALTAAFDEALRPPLPLLSRLVTLFDRLSRPMLAERIRSVLGVASVWLAACFAS